MRAAALVVLGLCAVAHAGNRVVVMSERPELSAALQLTLAGHQSEVETEPAAPTGEQRLDRAATAQRTAIASHADVAVWIDDNEVWAVLADGRDVRHAPLPADATPRVFAAIATSLVDELLAPPVAPVSVDVHVEVAPTPPTAVTPAPDAVVPPAPAIAVAAPAEVRPLDEGRASRTMIELGPTASSATYGLEAELSIALTAHVRAGVFGGLTRLFDGIGDYQTGTLLYDAGGELRYVGDGTVHFDVGIAAGITRGVTYMDPTETDTDNAGLVAFRLAVAREFTSGVGEVAIEPMLLFDALGHDKIPSLMFSARWGLRL